MGVAPAPENRLVGNRCRHSPVDLQ